MGKRIFFLSWRMTALAFWLVSLVAISLSGCQPEQKQLIIGGVLPLTGDAATFGVNASQGAELAVMEANQKGILPDTPILFQAEDSRGNPTEAVAAARKLIEVDQAKMLIGDVTSAGTHALIPVATDARTPLISPSASDPALSGASPFFARVWPSDVYEASVIAQHARGEDFEAIGIVFANTDYGVAMVDEFESAFGTDRVVAKIGVDRETLNYRPTIERLRRSDAEALFVVMYPEDYRRFLQQLSEAGLDLPILATATFEDPMLLDAPGSNNVVFASPKPPSEDDATRRQFVAAYEEKYGEEPGVLADTGYDAANILIKAYAEKGEEGPEAIMEYVRTLSNYPGVSGSLTFDEHGDVQKEYGLKSVQDGSFMFLNAEVSSSS